MITVCVGYTPVAAQSADNITGSWINEAGDVKIEIYKNANMYAGRITWLQSMYERDGITPRKDVQNAEPSLRGRSLLNLVILSGFTYDDGQWTGGTIYDPKTGKTYQSKMKVKGANLEIRGFVGSPMFGKTSTWTRPK